MWLGIIGVLSTRGIELNGMSPVGRKPRPAKVAPAEDLDYVVAVGVVKSKFNIWWCSAVEMHRFEQAGIGLGVSSC